jgi:hypothetical protein
MIDVLNNRYNFFKYRYLLVDNLVVLNEMSYLSKSSLLTYFGEQNLTTVLRTDLDYDPSQCPTLITLAKPEQFLDIEVIAEISEQAAIECFWPKRYVCSYIISDLNPAKIAQQLVNIGNNIATTLKEPYYPFFEPFRMQFLHEVGSSADHYWLKQQLTNIDYYYPSIHNGDFIQYKVDQPNQPNQPNQNWSESYLYRLKQIRIIHTLVNTWANNRLQFQEQQQLSLAKDVIVQSTQLVEQAYQLNLTDIEDILFWGLNGLRYQSDFTQHPQVLALIKQTQTQPGTLSKRLIDAKIKIENDSVSRQQ